MTCFWKGILHSLSTTDYQLLKSEYISINNPEKLIQLLKTHNQKTTSIKVNGCSLTNKELYENYKAINEYDLLIIHNGYWCSTSDPFLCLISQLFAVNIIHKYNKYDIIYTCENSKKNIYYQSNSDHFWFVRTSNVDQSTTFEKKIDQQSQCHQIIKVPKIKRKYR